MALLRTIRKTYQFFVDTPVKSGTVLNDRYHVLHCIGSGSYGLVYHCKDLLLDEDRVVKQLRQSKQRFKKEVALFEKEISVLHDLDHPQMPKLYRTFSEQKSHFYVMSYIEGENLEELIFQRKRKFHEKDALQIGGQLLELVAYLHEKGIFHLDLRIPNMLLQEDELFLIDFGLSEREATIDDQEEIIEMKRQDYYDIGDILLYLLYTTYSPKSKKALPWTEELFLEKETVLLLKRLLQLEEPYHEISEIAADLNDAQVAVERQSE